MMLILGIMIIMGSVFDIFMNTMSAPHIMLIVCGLLLILLNLPAIRLPFMKGNFTKALVKNVFSLIILALTALSLFGFFSANSIIPVKDDPKSIIRKAENISSASGAEKALAYLEKSSADLAWNKDVAFTAGELYDAAGHPENAKAKFIEVIGSNSFDLEARYKLAGLLLKEKNYNAAIEQLLFNVRINPSHSDSYMLLGDAYGEMGDQIRSIYYNKLSVSEAPASVEKRVKLAVAYANMNSFEEADLEFKKALEMASGFEEELKVYNGYDKVAAQEKQETQAEENSVE